MKKLPATLSNSSFLSKTFKTVLFLVALLPSFKVLAQLDSAVVTATGTSTWTAPAGVTSVTVRTWGGGGGGGGVSAAVATRGGGGGGGGGYSQSTVAVVPGTGYTVVVGTGGTAGSAAAGGPGGESYFNTAATVRANGGTGGGEGTGINGGGALGAGATAGIGTLTRTGGNGAAGVNGNHSGGGGGGAGTGGNGGNAVLAALGAGTAYGGGNGGAGRTTISGAGNAGLVYGGGGSGGCKATASGINEVGGVGANGRVTIIWNAATLIVTSVNVTNVSCNGGSNGSAAVSASGGVTPYTYSWNDANSQTTPTATGLSAGSYTVTLTDNTGTTSTASAVITQPDPLNASANVTSNYCNGGSSGSITAIPSGGTSPYTFSWNNSQTTGTATGLSAGTYTLTVTDSCGASSSVAEVITQPAPMSLSTTVLANVNCNGGNDGRVDVTPSGGTSPYTYSWNDINNQTTQTATGLLAGEYTVTVSDNCGVTLTAQAVITQPNPIIAVANVTNISCGGSTGSISVSLSGGSSPYTYSWSDGETTSSATGLSAGGYTVVITDYTECSATASASVTQPGSINISVNSSNILCNGQTNGSASASPSGGQVPYTYSWSNGQTGSSIGALSAGTYSIMITDNCGSVATTSVVITQPNTFTASAGIVSVSCAGIATVAAGPNGGTAPYTYTWFDAETTDTITGLSAGTYTVFVQDNNGCSATSSVVFSGTSVLHLTTTVLAEVTCNNGDNGRVTVTSSGGSVPYTYLWNDPNNQTTVTATGLLSGAYTVVVTDNCGTSATATAIVTQPTALTGTSHVVTSVGCNGGSTGSASISVSGGTSPYTYSWSNGNTTTSVTGLAAGTYTITVTDNNICPFITTVVITQPGVLGVLANATGVSCNGGDNGSISTAIGGGTSPYTYSWNDGNSQTTATATGLSIGSYTVVVTDNCGNTASSSAVVSEPNVLTVSANAAGNVTCNGGTNGSASASPSGGTAPYSYSWNNSQTGSTATGLSAGTYTVTVIDINGCNATTTASVTQPGVLNATTSVSGVTCFGLDNGRALANPGGGSAPYTYSWNDINTQTTQTATGLSYGSYTVTVQDDCGATSTAVAVITQPSTLTASVGITSNVSCFGAATGSTVSSATGGTSPYTYNWSNGETIADASGLSAGVYTVTITDNNGCSSTASASISQTNSLTASASATANVGCAGGATGSASASPSGGTAPYSYSWSGSQITSSVTGLSAGTYSVTVTDNCGASVTASVTITQPGALRVSRTSTDVTCNGGSNGTGLVSASGGTAPYTYSWTSGQTTASISGLSVGTYSVTVTDNCGTSATSSVDITQPGVLTTAAATVLNARCNGGFTGSVSGVPHGGSIPYTYLWNDVNSQTTDTATGLSAGIYIVTVTDNCGATATASATVTQPAVFSASAGVVSVTCSGVGVASASTSGGTSPYTYLWNDANSQTTATATGLTAGSYTVTVTDNCGASSTSSVSITANGTLTALASTVNNVSCNGGADGSVTVSASGGAVPYTYLWTGPGSQTTATATGLPVGTYTVTVTDNCGNSFTSSATVNQPIILTATTILNSVTCNGGNNGNASASPSGGTTPYTYSWSNGQTSVTATGLTAGIYSVTVSDICGDRITVVAIITQPTALAASTTVTGTSCNGGSNGSASSSPNGGTSPYTYGWSNGQTTSTATGLSAGTYTLIITDNCGASSSTTTTVTQPGVLAVSTGVTNVTCNGLNNGSAVASLTGGTSPFTYTWSNGETSAADTLLSNGTYSVSVTDSCGASVTASATVTQPTVLTASANGTNISCFGVNSGTATAAPSGGTSPYTYAWNDGGSQSTITASNLVAGSYTVTVTDNNGCSATASVVLTQPATAVSISIASFTNVNCTILGSIVANAATGGVSPYTYSWSNGEGSNLSISNLSAGTYIITVVDSNGCNASASAVITQPASSLGVSTASITDVSCNGGTGSATANAASGGTSPYTYVWSDAGSQTSLTATGLSAGTYSITVTDSSGCIAVAMAVITQPASALSVTIANVVNVACYGGTGSITANTPAGGTAPFTYTWTPSGGASITASGLSAGVYTLTVTDAHGCTAVDSATITQPAAAVAISISSVTNISCFGDRASITANAATGGTSPYVYSWSPSGGTNLTASNLTAGTYTITATDNNRCTASAIVTITTPSSALWISIASHSNVTCNGGSNGSATSYSATGGTGPYTYAWSPSGGTDVTASNLSAGIYTITVMDNNGCSTSANVNITQPASAVGISVISETGVSCFGGSNGKITAHAGTGGTAPYYYNWTPSGGTNDVASNLSAGVYTITVTDNSGCSASASATVTQPATAVSISIASQSNINCFGERGSITANAGAGGTSPYTYHWSPSGGTDLTASNLTAGIYSITVTDNNGCSATASAVITSPASALGITMSSVANAECFGDNGTATANAATGGSSPYTYSWSPSGGTNLSANVAPGTYTITVIDNNGCSATARAIITQPAQMDIRTDSTDETRSTPCNGVASITVRGGTAPYTYHWVTGGQTTASITGQCAGTWCCVVTDSHGCSQTVCVTIKSTVGIENISDASSINMYPNPNSGQFTITGVERGMIVEVYDYTGRKISTLSANDVTMQVNIADVANGVYLIRITDKDGTLITEKKMVKVQ